MATHWKERFTIVPAVFLLVRNGQGKVLLLQRANTGFCDGYYGLPSGHLDGQETARQAACREGLEEAGITVLPENLEFLNVTHENAEGHERIGIIFGVSKYEGEPCIGEPEKCSGLLWSDLDNLPENVVPQVREMLINARHGNFYAEYGF